VVRGSSCSSPGFRLTFTLTARHNGPQEFYIRSARLNGASLDRTFISHHQIIGGGLVFEMGSSPNEHFGVATVPGSPWVGLTKALAGQRKFTVIQVDHASLIQNPRL
jgi:putative alpha-1,2-mannosidase